MIKYKIIEKFLNSSDCKNLINDAENIFNNIGSREILITIENLHNLQV